MNQLKKIVLVVTCLLSLSHFAQRREKGLFTQSSGGVFGVRKTRPGDGEHHVQEHEESRDEICNVATNYTQNIQHENGLTFLLNKGVVLALSNPTNNVFSAGETVQIALYNCGNCTDPDQCRVSFNARLVGENAISSSTVYSEPTGDYTVEFTTPPVAGEFRLDLSVRWWNGLDEPGQTSKNFFLGGNGWLNLRPDDAFTQAEEACIVFGSPLAITVISPMQHPGKYAHCKALQNQPGFWERVNHSSICTDMVNHTGECFVLDKINRDWLWRGSDCRYEFFSPTQVLGCLNDTSIFVFGDSLSAEVYHNLVNYVPSLDGKRLFVQLQSPFFGNVSRLAEEIPTRRVFVLTNFKIAHLIWRHPMKYLEDAVVPSMKREWGAVQNATRDKHKVHGVFYAGYPAHFQRERFITKDRMAVANAVLGKAASDLGFSIFNTTIPLSSRPDASWDGFHFLQVNDKVGGASKMVAMMLLNHICLGSLER